jgi:hypothetical protein
MSRRNQRSLALLSLAAVLFLVVPAPARGMGVGDWQIPALLSGKAWQWLAKLWPGGDGHAPRKEGSIIDPNGMNPDSSPALPIQGDADAEGDEGSIIDPNGLR